METTKNKLPVYAQNFFNKLKNYLDTKIYYYGSIQRNDYFPKSSDIDVDIFTDNESSTLLKIQNLLNIPKSEFRKFIYKLHKTNELVNGTKFKYEFPNTKNTTEISIYNNKYKNNVLIEHNSKVQIPYYISILLIILKFIYYNLGILPDYIYSYFKKLLMNYCIEGKEVEFISIDIPEEEKEEDKNKIK